MTNCPKILHFTYYWTLTQFCTITINIFILDLAYTICMKLILWSNIKLKKNCYQLDITFHPSKMFLFLSFFFLLLTCISIIILLDAMLLALILSLSFLHALRCLYIKKSHKSNMNNSFRIIFIKLWSLRLVLLRSIITKSTS